MSVLSHANNNADQSAQPSTGFEKYIILYRNDGGYVMSGNTPEEFIHVPMVGSVFVGTNAETWLAFNSHHRKPEHRYFRPYELVISGSLTFVRVTGDYTAEIHFADGEVWSYVLPDAHEAEKFIPILRNPDFDEDEINALVEKLEQEPARQDRLNELHGA